MLENDSGDRGEAGFVSEYVFIRFVFLCPRMNGKYIWDNPILPLSTAQLNLMQFYTVFSDCDIISIMTYEYRKIPFCTNIEVCDTAPMELAVRTVDTHKYLHVGLNGSGYPQVRLRKRNGGDGKQYGLHVLVAEIWIGPRPEGLEIDHIDTNKLNFCHTNLHYVTSKENSNNPLTRKQHTEAAYKTPVLQIDKITKTVIAEYSSLSEAERQTSIPRSNISTCCKGKYKSAGGFIWRYQI